MPVEVIGIDHVYVTVREPRALAALLRPRHARCSATASVESMIGGDPHVHYFNRQFGFSLRPARADTPDARPLRAGSAPLLLPRRRRARRRPRARPSCARWASPRPIRATTPSTRPTTTRRSSRTPTASGSRSPTSARVGAAACSTGTTSERACRSHALRSRRRRGPVWSGSVMTTLDLTVRASTYGKPPTDLAARVNEFSKRERMQRGGRAFLPFFAAGCGLLLVPPHVVWLLLWTSVGIVFGRQRYRQEREFVSLRGRARIAESPSRSICPKRCPRSSAVRVAARS